MICPGPKLRMFALTFGGRARGGQRLAVNNFSEAEVDIGLHSGRELSRSRQFDHDLHHIKAK